MDSIDDVIHRTEAAFNANDPEALADTFADDAWSVGVTGQVLHGRAEILDVSRQLFAGGLKEQFARYVVDEVRHLAPDVAVARKLVYATDERGNDLAADHAMVALYVLVRGETGWRVVAHQNTIVQ